MNSSEKQNLTVMVQMMIMNSFQQFETIMQPEDAEMVTPESIRSAGIVVMITPMLLVYPFLQKHFVKGVMIGSIKG